MAANYTYTAQASDRGLVSIHGRRLIIIGDGQPSSPSALALDNVVVANKRSGPNSLKLIAAGLTSGAPTTGTGGIAFTGVKAGDSVEMVVNLTALTDVTASFESTISTAGFIQQTAASVSGTCLFFVQPQVS